MRWLFLERVGLSRFGFLPRLADEAGTGLWSAGLLSWQKAHGHVLGFPFGKYRHYKPCRDLGRNTQSDQMYQNEIECY